MLLENDTIEAIEASFQEMIVGKGMSIMYTVKIKPKNNDTSYITFTPKDPEKTASMGEIFQYAMLVGRDFLQDPECVKFKEAKRKFYEQNGKP